MAWQRPSRREEKTLRFGGFGSLECEPSRHGARLNQRVASRSWAIQGETVSCCAVICVGISPGLRLAPGFIGNPSGSRLNENLQRQYQRV